MNLLQVILLSFGNFVDMYHFVKIRFCLENKAYWYLKPECKQDIIDHFNKICGREFQEGFEDYINNVVVKKDHNGEPYLYSRNI